MILAAAIGVALAGGLLSLGLALRLPRAAAAIAIGAAAVVAGVGLTMDPGATLLIGGTALVASDEARLAATGWAAGLVLLGLLGLASGRAAIVTGAGLLALAAGLTALTVDGPTTAFAALAVGALVATIVPALAGWLGGHGDEPPVGLAARSAAAATSGGLLGLVFAAWSISPSGPLGSTGVVEPDAAARSAAGLALVAMAAIVIVRGGGIPAHLWAARFVGGVSTLAVPSALAWGTAVFAIVALRWSSAVAGSVSLRPDDVERLLVLGAALASVLLGGLASMLHDDLEHILGYLLIQDVGVGLFAFAAIGPDATLAATTWLLASAAVGMAFAGWIAATSWAFGTRRLPDLGGWARRAPILAASGALVVVGAVGIPGMALFDARADLVAGALPEWLGPVVIGVATVSPVLALGRVLAAGLRRSSIEVARAPNARVGRVVGAIGGWSGRGPRWWLRTGASVARANAGVGVGVVTILLGAIGLAIAVVGVGTAAS